MTVSLKTQCDCARFFHTYKRDVSAVGFQVRACLFERLYYTGFQAIGVQAIQQQQGANEIIPTEGIYDGGIRIRRIMKDFEHPLDALAMKLHKQLHKFFRRCLQRWIFTLFNFMDQILNRF